MDQPLTQRALFGSGKLEELLLQVRSNNVNVLFVYNALSTGQRKALSELADCRVLSFQSDFAQSIG
jgi:50S ribosomal subunit-associated GTPase HflX